MSEAAKVDHAANHVYSQMREIGVTEEQANVCHSLRLSASVYTLILKVFIAEHADNLVNDAVDYFRDRGLYEYMLHHRFTKLIISSDFVRPPPRHVLTGASQAAHGATPASADAPTSEDYFKRNQLLARFSKVAVCCSRSFGHLLA